MLGYIYNMIPDSAVQLEILLKFLKRKPRKSSESGALVVNQCGIEFKDVGFSYPNTENPVFNRLNLVMKEKQTIAIVGPSGTGKTTISRILFGLYDTFTGKVSLDGRDIRNYNPDELSEAICIVPHVNDSHGN